MNQKRRDVFAMRAERINAELFSSSPILLPALAVVGAVCGLIASGAAQGVRRLRMQFARQITS